MEKYEVVRIAGRGAYGTAYLARRKTDGREVILKQIPIEQLNSADRQRIQARMLSRYEIAIQYIVIGHRHFVHNPLVLLYSSSCNVIFTSLLV